MKLWKESEKFVSTAGCVILPTRRREVESENILPFELPKTKMVTEKHDFWEYGLCNADNKLLAWNYLHFRKTGKSVFEQRISNSVWKMEEIQNKINWESNFKGLLTHQWKSEIGF